MPNQGEAAATPCPLGSSASAWIYGACLSAIPIYIASVIIISVYFACLTYINLKGHVCFVLKPWNFRIKRFVVFKVCQLCKITRSSALIRAEFLLRTSVFWIVEVAYM